MVTFLATNLRLLGDLKRILEAFAAKDFLVVEKPVKSNRQHTAVTFSFRTNGEISDPKGVLKSVRRHLHTAIREANREFMECMDLTGDSCRDPLWDNH